MWYTSVMDTYILTQLVDQGLTIREIAAQQSTSPTNVRYWLNKNGLKTISKKQKICIECSKELTYKGTLCNSCKSNVQRFKLRGKILDYFEKAACSRCGYDKCSGALHAHHLDPTQKSFSISGSHTRSWKKIKDELGKCVLICANCHAEEHHDCFKYSCAYLSTVRKAVL